VTACDPPFVDVGASDEVPPGRQRAVEAAGRQLLVCNVGGELYAVSNRCTHAAWPMDGDRLDGWEIVCGLHGARFDVRDGSPTAGPARKPLACYPLRVRDGRIEVRVPPPPR